MTSDLQERWRHVLCHRGSCPRCDGLRVWHNGIRWRKATLRHGEQSEFSGDVPVRRLRCGDCCKRWCHAPDEVTTRAHYQPCVVAEAVARDVLDDATPTVQIAREHGCHPRTIGRWIERVAGVADPALLSRRLLADSATVVCPSPPAVLPARRSPGFAARCLRAVWVLALLEALASLHGLAPPGLAHARRFVPALATPSVARPRADSGG